MAQNVAEVMTCDPRTIEVGRPVADATQLMRQADTGALAVTDNGTVAGSMTGRDIAVRVVAEHKDPSTPLREACSRWDLATAGPDTAWSRPSGSCAARPCAACRGKAQECGVLTLWLRGLANVGILLLVLFALLLGPWLFTKNT